MTSIFQDGCWLDDSTNLQVNELGCSMLTQCQSISVRVSFVLCVPLINLGLKEKDRNVYSMGKTRFVLLLFSKGFFGHIQIKLNFSLVRFQHEDIRCYFLQH